MNSVIITGHKSNIAKEFCKLIPSETIYGIRIENIEQYLTANRYLFCQGFLVSKRSKDQTKEEIKKSKYINYTSITQAVKKIIEVNSIARICIISSESAYQGSYDNSYAQWKKEINNYIENTNLLTEKQQLVGIAPSIIEDTSMTKARKDIQNLNNKRETHPMKRFLWSKEVANLIYVLLYEQPYINRTVIRMHGGSIGN